MTSATSTTSSTRDGASADGAPALTAGRLTHLQRLEAEAIHIMREAVAETASFTRRPRSTSILSASAGKIVAGEGKAIPRGGRSA